MRPWNPTGLLLMSVAGALTGCGALSVPEPDLITAGALTGSTGADALRAGAIGRFTVGYVSTAGSSLFSQITATGLLSDELMAVSSGLRLLDDRTVDGFTDYGNLAEMSGARVAAEQASIALRRSEPSNVNGLAEMYALAGFVDVMLGESYCSGVAPGHVSLTGTPTEGTPLTTAELINEGLANFDSALAIPGISPPMANLARVGAGRALLDLGQFAPAATAVAGVGTGFVYAFPFSAATAQTSNGIQLWYWLIGSATVSDSEGGVGLPFRSANDPRVVVATGTGPDGVTPIYLPQKYATASSPVTLASGVEARLIEAEASLNASNTAAWLAALNALRADTADTHVAGLTPLVDPGTDHARQDLTFRERAFWLFLTSHRVGDLRRLIRQYGRTQATVFPSGAYPGAPGGTYGTDVNLPLPQAVRNNPNSRGCLDRNA